MDYLKPGLMMCGLGLIKYLDLTDESVINNALIGYFSCLSVCLLILLIIYLRIKSRNDTSPLIVKESDIDAQKAASSSSNPILTALGGGSNSSDGYGRNIETSNNAYDLIKFNELLKTMILGPIITLFLYYKWSFIQPLVMQSIMNISNILTSELCRIYIFNSTNKQLLKRPWRSSSGIMSTYKQLRKEINQMQNSSTTNSTSNSNSRKAENRKKVLSGK